MSVHTGIDYTDYFSNSKTNNNTGNRQFGENFDSSSWFDRNFGNWQNDKQVGYNWGNIANIGSMAGQGLSGLAGLALAGSYMPAQKKSIRKHRLQLCKKIYVLLKKQMNVDEEWQILLTLLPYLRK